MYDRFMRILVLFDLPTKTKNDKRNYTGFRKNLIRMGFDMLQYSVYCRVTRNHDDASKYVFLVKSILPPRGSVRLLMITEKQYESMIIMLGKKSPSEDLLVPTDYLEL